MNITCPFCQTIFEVDPNILLKKNTTNVKCSVCKNTWVYKQEKPFKVRKNSSYMKIFILNILLIMSFIISAFVFKDIYFSLGGFWVDIYIFIESLVPIK